jgi:hypothetical protein
LKIKELRRVVAPFSFRCTCNLHASGEMLERDREEEKRE